MIVYLQDLTEQADWVGHDDFLTASWTIQNIRYRVHFTILSGHLQTTNFLIPMHMVSFIMRTARTVQQSHSFCNFLSHLITTDLALLVDPDGSESSVSVLTCYIMISALNET